MDRIAINSKITWHLECSFPGCESKIETTYDVPAYSTVPRPLTREDWNNINGNLYCEKHPIEIKSRDNDILIVRL